MLDNYELAYEALWCLEYLNDNGHTLAIASFNTNASYELKRLNIDHFFTYIEALCPEQLGKTTLINKIIGDTPLDQIIFFDDLETNIEEVSKLGIKSYKVNPSVGISVLDICEAGL